MTNLLPVTVRNDVRRVLWLRLLLVGASMSALTGLVSIFALTPALFAATIPLFSRAPIVSDAAKEQIALFEEARAQASRTRGQLTVLAPYAIDVPQVHSVLERVYALRPSGVSITTIKYQTGEQGQLVITGVSEAREPLNDYRTALVETALFSGVSVPVAALVGALEGNFSMTLTGAF